MKKLLSCDFDGVICKRSGIPTKEDWENDPPMEGARDAIKYLMDQGYEVYVQTANDLRRVKHWLRVNRFPKMDVTHSKKKGTIAYFDDRAIRFTNWNDIRKYFV